MREISRTTRRIGALIAPIIALFALISCALAGTEDGSFCPTCPDWNNLDGWFEQKEAYYTPPQATTPAAQAAPAQISATPSYPRAWLATSADHILEGQVILDARSPEEFSTGHIPDARNVYWETLRSGDSLDPEKVEQALEKAGVNRSDHLLISGGTDDAAYLFWALEYLGQDNLSLLDGGQEAYRAGGHALVNGEDDYGNRSNTSDYAVEARTWLLVNESTLEATARSVGVQLVDARKSFADYGRIHLRGAIQIPAEEIYSDGRLIGPDALDELFAGRGLEQKKTIIVYAQPEAASLYWALRTMGYNVAIIDGSWWMDSAMAVSNIRPGKA
ncbi:MAG: hypothetical protein JW986_06755 [Methanotrichaceae archaeon]|nr:hypothetical protein [Methanotrichaceae archaeon]